MKLIIVITLMTQFGCAYAAISERMQPDQTYRIDVDGNSAATDQGVRKAAHERAANLCPAGYATVTDFSKGHDDAAHALVVKCK